MVAFFSPTVPYVVPTTMIDVVKHLGLTSSHVLCLDAGDSSSYNGSSQTWTDVSGNGNSFYRGSGSGSDGFDPTFNGTAGRQSSSEYFSSDGGDAFWQTGSHTFANNWHKDGATYTVATWCFLPSGMTSPPSFSILRNYYGDNTEHGIRVAITPLSSSGKILFNYGNGSAIQAGGPPTSDLVVENSWMFCAMSFSEGSGASFAFYNGTVDVFSTDSLTSPSSSNPSKGIAIWGGPGIDGTPFYSGAGNALAPSGARLASLNAWNRALSQAELTSLYNSTKAKCGL